MPRNFFDLKSGGGNSYAVPHPEKWGGTRPPPRPPPIDARAGAWPSRSILKLSSKWCILKGVLAYSLVYRGERNV